MDSLWFVVSQTGSTKGRMGCARNLGVVLGGLYGFAIFDAEFLVSHSLAWQFICLYISYCSHGQTLKSVTINRSLGRLTHIHIVCKLDDLSDAAWACNGFKSPRDRNGHIQRWKILH